MAKTSTKATAKGKQVTTVTPNEPTVLPGNENVVSDSSVAATTTQAANGGLPPEGENHATGTVANSSTVEGTEPATANLDELMASYGKAYPKNKTFYIATDGQVFLGTNKREAEAHQKFIKAKAELTIYSV